jgi:hypothetical protein
MAAAAGGMVVGVRVEPRTEMGTGWIMNGVRTWHGRCVHPKMYVVPERIQAIVARANPRGLGYGRGRRCGRLVLALCLCIALHFLEEPTYGAAPRDDFRVRVVEGVAADGQTTCWETFHACAEGEELEAARVGIVERKAG